MKRIYALVIALFLGGAVVAGTSTQTALATAQKGLVDQVIRFHVLANSDSQKDQLLKLKVRDQVLAYLEAELEGDSPKKQTWRFLELHQTKIQEIAQDVIREEGYDYPVKVILGPSTFPVKHYGDVIFPAGEYEALRIEIGEALGHNWWCCLYPNLCFMDETHAAFSEESKETLRQTLTEEELGMVTMDTRFRPRWKFLESIRRQ